MRYRLRSGRAAPCRPLRRLPRCLIIGGVPARALPQGLLQRHRTVMLLQEIREGFVGQVLKIPHAVARQKLQRLPRLVIDLDSLAGHQRAHRLRERLFGAPRSQLSGGIGLNIGASIAGLFTGGSRPEATVRLRPNDRNVAFRRTLSRRVLPASIFRKQHGASHGFASPPPRSAATANGSRAVPEPPPPASSTRPEWWARPGNRGPRLDFRRPCPPTFT